MNLKRIIDIYEVIKDRLPKTYPRPKMAFYEDEDCLATDNKIRRDFDNLYAVCDPDSNTIKLPLTMKIEYTDKRGIKHYRNTPVTKMDEGVIANTILHEIGHLYAGEKYGYDSKTYHDETYCNRFAARWVRRLKKERLIDS